MKIGDLVRYKELPSMGLGLIVGFKEGSSGVFVRWLTMMNKTSMEADIMLEVVNENNENR